MHVVPNYSTCKLLCEYRGKQVKVEVNQTKRGIVGGDVIVQPLSDKAQEEFGLYCEAHIVPLTQLYGGKIAAALSRQHPRDLFDVKYMNVPIADCREGLIFRLLGSDRPIHESFAPSLIDQRAAMVNQFDGMTDIPFTYEEFEQTRSKLIEDVNTLMTDEDKRFLVSFEKVNRAGEKFSPDQIIGTLQDMNFLKVTGEGYIPTYTRTDLTNHLHGSAGFRTDTQIVTKKAMKSIIASIKTSKDEKDNDEA